MTISQTPSAPSDANAADRSPQRPGLNTETLAMGGVFLAFFAFLAAIFAVILAATAVDEARSSDGSSGSSGSGASSASATTVSLSEFAITPGSLTVASGARLQVRNDGETLHNLSVDGIVSRMLDPGKSDELDLGSLEPGTYTMKCDVPGHEDAGMKGMLTIE